MNPLVLFDYVYYTFAYLYGIQWGYDKDKEYTGIAFLSLIQFFNAFAIFGFIGQPLYELTEVNPLIVTFAGSFIFIILNIIRYKRVITYAELSEKWNKEGKRIVIIKKTGVILYIISTFILAIFSVRIN